MPRRIDGALAATGEEDQLAVVIRGLGTRIDAVLTGLTQGFLNISGEGFGFFGSITLRFIGLNRW